MFGLISEVGKTLTYRPSWNATNNKERFNVSSNYGTCRDNCSITNMHASNHRRTCAHPHIGPKDCFLEARSSAENDRRARNVKHMIVAYNTDSRSKHAVRANGYSRSYVAPRPDVAVCTGNEITVDL